MPEPKKPTRTTAAPPVPARPAPVSARPAPGDQLEELNDQLARFLQHADQLVDEWAKFGADVRRTVDAEVARIDGAVADATERALANTSAQVDRVAAERIEKTVEHAAARWRGDPPRVASGGGGTATSTASGGGLARGVLLAVLVANALLVVLLVVALRKDTPAAVAPSPTPETGGAGAAVIAPEVLAACDALAEGTWSADDAALVLRAGTAVCGDDEAAVTATVTARFATPEVAVDAGVVDAVPPIDAKKREPKRGK